MSVSDVFDWRLSSAFLSDAMAWTACNRNADVDATEDTTFTLAMTSSGDFGRGSSDVLRLEVRDVLLPLLLVFVGVRETVSIFFSQCRIACVATVAN